MASGDLLGKVLRHGTAYLVGHGLLAVLGVVLLPITTRIFTKSEFGAIAAVESAARLVALIVSLQLLRSYSRFYVEYRDDRDSLAQCTSTVFWSTAAWGLVTVPVCLLAARSWGGLEQPVFPVLAAAFLAPMLGDLGAIAAKHLQQNHRAKTQMGFVLTHVVFRIVVMLVLVVVFGMGVAGAFLGSLAGTALLVGLAVWVLRRDGILRATYSPKMLKESVLFALPLIPGVLATWVTGFSDRLLIVHHDSFEEAGVYQVGVLLGRGLALAGQSVSLVYAPMLLALLRDRPRDAKSHLERFLPNNLLLLGLVALGLAAFAQEAVFVLAPQGYAAAAAIVPPILVALLLRTLCGVFHVVLGFQGRTGVIGLGLVLEAAVNLGLNVWWIPLHGKTAAAWIMLVTAVFHAIWFAWCSQKHFALAPGAGRLLRISAWFAVGGCAAWALPHVPGLAALTVPGVLAKTAIVAATAAGLWFTGCVLPADRARLRTLAARALSRRG